MEMTGKIWLLFNSVSEKQTKPLTDVQMQMLILTLKTKDIHDFYIWTPGWDDWKALLPFLQSQQKFFMMAPVLPKMPSKKAKMDPVKRDLDSDATEITPKEESTIKSMDSDKTAHFYEATEVENFYTQVDPQKPTAKPDYGYYFNDFKAEDIDINAKVPNKEKKDKKIAESQSQRTDPRHDFKIEVVLISRSGKSFKTTSKNISLGGTFLADPVPKDFLNGEFDLIFINTFEKDKARGRVHLNAKIVGDFSNPCHLTFNNPSKESILQLEYLLKSYNQQAANLTPKKKLG